MSTEQDNLIMTEIWNTYYPKILALCKNKLESCPGEAEDVAAEVFNALVNECRIRKIPDKIDAWLYKVAYNMINQKYKEMYKRKKFLVNVDFSNQEEAERLNLRTDVDMDDARIDDEDIETMKDTLLTELTDEEQLLIDLICDKKMKLKDVGERINKSTTAVKQKYYRTVRKARKKAKESVESFK